MNTLSLVRRALFIVLTLGLAGTALDLVLIAHYEDTLQLVPLIVVGIALGVLLWHRLGGSAASVRALQGTMALCVLAGAVGAGLHYRGAAEFQWEIDPSQTRWQVFQKVMRAKAPPVLASGIMVQLGLVGLVYGYRHPALDWPGRRSSSNGVGND